MPLTIRTATPADIPLLLPLISSAYRGDESRKGWTTEADLLTGDRIRSDGLLEKIEDPNGVMLMAFTASTNNLIACCEILKQANGAGYFGLFAVQPALQGGGVGKEVLGIAERYARDSMGLRALEMQVIWTRKELIAWYVRRGYVVSGERREFPYQLLVGGQAGALRDDLWFEILRKDLVDGNAVGAVGNGVPNIV